jgi:hypothetical protein
MSRPSSSWLVLSPTPTYATFIWALPSEVFIAIEDLIRDVTAGISADNKKLSSPFAASSLHQCFKLPDLPSLDDCCPSALFAKMQALLPHDTNILLNTMFQHCLQESMKTTLAIHGKVNSFSVG